LHQVGDLFELNVKLRRQKVKEKLSNCARRSKDAYTAFYNAFHPERILYTSNKF